MTNTDARARLRDDEEDENPCDVIYDMLGDFMCEVFLTPMWGERVVGYRDWRTGLRRDQPAAGSAERAERETK